MTSAKKIQANRRNALKSTGPKTQQGKDIARLNATKHGLLSQEVLLPGEDEAAFEELGERLRAELQPVGELESMLVEQIVTARWRLRRLRRVEAGVFAWELYEELAERAEKEISLYERSSTEGFLEKRFGSSTIITNFDKRDEAVSKFREIKTKQEAETATLGRTFIRDAQGANAFSKLSRYETAIERSFYKALNELQRLQTARDAETKVPPPAVVDINVSGISGEDL